MTIAPGTRLDPYGVGAKLGEGGMGEVWRATDPRLEREVALEVLPASFTADPERLARFEREARLLAQLHHPNAAGLAIEDALAAPEEAAASARALARGRPWAGPLPAQLRRHRRRGVRDASPAAVGRAAPRRPRLVERAAAAAGRRRLGAMTAAGGRG